MKKKDPVCSVFMITYNHEKYIAQAIEGVINQQTDFSYELVLGEDCSTDSTRQICIEYKHKYSDKIKLLLPQKNLGLEGRNNAQMVLENCSGKFIAMCDGDDYWTDPFKLQKQVDFLRQNPEYTICWTKATYLDVETGKQFVPETFDDVLNGKDIYTIELNSYYSKYAVPTPTAVFISEKLPIMLLKKLPFVNDSVMFFILLGKGKGALLNFNSAVYRIHSSGAWSGSEDYLKKMHIFSALDTAFSIMPGLTKYEHLVSWHKWNLTQAYYLFPESSNWNAFRKRTLLLIKIIKYQNSNEKRKAIKSYFKKLFFRI